MTTAQRGASPRVAWLYPEASHRSNPILVQALGTLACAGAEVRLYDLAPSRVESDGSYLHVAGGRFRFWPEGVTSFGVRGLLLLGRMFARVLAWHPHVIVTGDPDVGLIGWLASRILGVPHVYYPFELYGEEYMRRDTRLTRVLLRLEGLMLAHGIDGLITQNSFRGEVYRERGTRVSPVVVHNYKPRWQGEKSDELKRLLGVDPACRVVLYEGVLQPGRCLENVISAVTAFPPNTMLALIGRQGDYYRDVLAPLAATVAPSKIRFIPGVPHEELLRLVAGADAGFVVYEDRSRNNRFCAPGKLSDYVNAGIPVVASALPTLGPVVDSYGIGASFDNDSPSSIAAAVTSVLKRSKAEWQPALREAQRHLVWETQEETLRRAVLGDVPRSQHQFPPVRRGAA